MRTARLAVMDIRGHGDSSADWPQYHPTAVGHDIAAVIRHPGGPAVIVGHSFAAKSAGHGFATLESQGGFRLAEDSEISFATLTRMVLSALPS